MPYFAIRFYISDKHEVSKLITDYAVDYQYEIGKKIESETKFCMEYQETIKLFNCVWENKSLQGIECLIFDYQFAVPILVENWAWTPFPRLSKIANEI